jgi:arsenate reductase-like glutaredoxin family protein
MTSHVTLWGRNDDAESRAALQFLRAHGFAADRVLDIDRRPPTPEERDRIEAARGRLLGTPLPAPILLTPKGALVGFREHAWTKFLEVGKNHDE